MTYTKQEWQDGNTDSPYGPVSAERLAHIEDGIGDAHDHLLPAETDEADVLTVVSGVWAGAAPSGGSQSVPTVLCYLESSSPVADGAFVPWETIYDARQNVLGSLPSEMGLSLTNNGGGTHDTVTVDEAGVWTFELMCNAPKDATAFVDILLSISGDRTGGPRQAGYVAVAEITEPEFCLTSTTDLIAGDTVAVIPNVTNPPAPTLVGYAGWSYGLLKLIRWR